MTPVPLTVKDALAEASRRLAGSAAPSLDAMLLLGHILGRKREWLMLNEAKLLEQDDEMAFFAAVARRQQCEPIAYITGIKEFWSLDFYATRDTLIPRPDSETLVEAALMKVPNRAKPIALLDIGTGTGCLLAALLNELPSAWGIGVDNSERALQVARKNAKLHGLDVRAQFVRSHWCDALNGTFDLIVSNPPYIAEDALAALMPDVARYEPRSALAGGADGLDCYRSLAPRMPAFLKPGGYALFEVGQGQAQDVERLLEAEGLELHGTQTDLAGVARCVIAQKKNQ